MTARAAARSGAQPGRLLAAVALVAVIGTGCANAPAEAGGGDDPNATPGATPSPAELQQLLKIRRAFATCMRENGVADFPDPDADGHIIYNGDDPDLKPTSEKCDDLTRANPGPT